jgi:transglutaminase-like putative cysteine protease
VASLAHPIPAAPRPPWSLARVTRGMTPAEGWASVILLGIVLLCTAWTVARTDVAPDGVSMAVLAIGGLLTGLGLAKLSTPDLLAHLFAILSGVFASLLLAAERMPLALGGRLARLGALGDLAAQWLAQAQAGDPLDDPRLLSIMLGAAVWLVAYTSAWVLFRRGWLTTALALPGAIALANLGYAPEQGTLPLLVMVVAGTMLAARHAVYRREVEWSRAQLPYPRRTVPRFLFGGIVIALLVAALAWTLPLSTRDSLFGAAWERINEPLEEVASRWNDLVSRFGGPGDNSDGTYSAFGDSFRLGGHLELSDDPVIVLQPAGGAMRPAYLAGQRYDKYDGHGWATTVDDTFEEIGPNGKRYSSRMSFRTGQGVQLSPDLLTDRSQVEAEMTVIRPKGDLLFTLDTYLAADRRTNVQLSWRQLENERLPFVPGEPASLPQDLQRIGALVGRGSYTPPSDGGVNADSPLPLDPTLAAEIQAERDALLTRFLDVGWEIGPNGRAQALRVSGQLPVYDDVEAVFSQDDVAQGDAYAVSGLTSTAGPDQLRTAGTAYPTWVTDRYLELPETVTDRTRELASQLAAGQPSAFDTAVAVEEYVRSAITYNEDIDPPPDNQDVVDYVLFESREGYCEYYASAMAVLLRAEGIPSRVVGGYFPAPYDPNEGGHLYREKNAHLWVEAFFPGYGWIPFEPTANRERLDYGDLAAPAQEPAPPTPVLTPPPAVAEPTPPPVVETPAEPPPVTPPDILSDPARLAGWIGLALAALVAVAGTAAATAWFVGFRGLSPVSSLYARALRAGNWLGVPPRVSLTPHEYADRVGRVVPSAQGPARVVAELYTQERYAGRRPDGEALRAARDAWRDLRGIAIGSLLRRNRGGRRL